MYTCTWGREEEKTVTACVIDGGLRVEDKFWPLLLMGKKKIKHRSSDGAFLAISSMDGYCSFVTFEKDELGKPLKEKPQINVRTSGATEKKVKKIQSHKVVSPGSRLTEGTPSSRVNDPSIPTLQPRTPTTAGKDFTSTPVGIKNVPVSSSDERKIGQPANRSTKVNQPRRITLNTLQAWSKTPRWDLYCSFQ